MPFVFNFDKCLGLPKAARFHYERGFAASSVMKLAGATKDDVLYTSLPLYHSSAGMLGVLGTIYLGKMVNFSMALNV